ncbi:MAG: aminopeptidase [Bacillota bacterium]
MGAYEFELSAAAGKLVGESLRVKPGEVVAITADTLSDEEVVRATAAAVLDSGGKPLVLKVATPRGVGKAADPDLPVEALARAVASSQAWVEYNHQWLLYSGVYEHATAANPELRYLCLCGMTADLMVRAVGRVDTAALRRFLEKVRDLTSRATSMRITTPAGTEVSFQNVGPDHFISCDWGDASTPGVWMLAGQVGWSPRLETVEGTIVFDGSLCPPLGILKAPISLEVREGRIVSIAGGPQAEEFRAWLESFRDPNMLRLGHVCYGFNPGARLTGNVLEDERVWGCTEWGIGYMSPIDVPPDGIRAASHCDGICLNSSVWLDGVQILDRGRVVGPELEDLATAARGG